MHNEHAFIDWMHHEHGLNRSTSQSRLSNCRRVEKYEGDLDTHYASDQCITLLQRLNYTLDDAAMGRQVRHNIRINGNQYNGTATLRSAVQLYVGFRSAWHPQFAPGKSVSTTQTTMTNSVVVPPTTQTRTMTHLHRYDNDYQMRSIRMKHRWTEGDDVVALYLWRFGPSKLGRSIEVIAAKLGMPIKSMLMRIQNFQSVSGQGGLPHAARQSRKIFAQFSTLSETELRTKVLLYLDKTQLHTQGDSKSKHVEYPKEYARSQTRSNGKSRNKTKDWQSGVILGIIVLTLALTLGALLILQNLQF